MQSVKFVYSLELLGSGGLQERREQGGEGNPAVGNPLPGRRVGDARHYYRIVVMSLGHSIRLPTVPESLTDGQRTFA